MAQLPEELLLQVCSYLCFSASEPCRLENRVKRATLCSLSLASKTCNRIARPYLYSVFNTTERRTCLLRPFLNTIVQQPRTAKLVKQIHANPWVTEVDVEWGGTLLIPPPPDVLNRFQSAVGSLNLSAALRRRIDDGLAVGLQDAELALLLCLCPNVQVMDMQTVPDIKSTSVVAVIQEAILRPQELGSAPLQHLREVEIAHCDTVAPTDLREVETFFQLPALQTFRGSLLDCCSGFSASLNYPVKHVYLAWSLLTPGGLEGLLRSCPQLETFSIYTEHTLVGPSDETVFHQFGEVLRLDGRGLKHLRLRTEDTFDVEERLSKPMGSLKELASLRFLGLPFTAVFGNLYTHHYNQSLQQLLHTLPKSLRELEIGVGALEDHPGLDAVLAKLNTHDDFKDLSIIAGKLDRHTPYRMGGRRSKSPTVGEPTGRFF